MAASRTSSAVALIVGATGLMLTCVFGFLSFIPSVDPTAGEFFQLAFFVGGVLGLGGVIAYVVMIRRGGSGERASKFDRHLEQRKAALGALPIGLVAVLIGVLWFMIHTLAPAGFPSNAKYADFKIPGIIAFLGFGTLYVAMATWLAIREERTAIRWAREDAGVHK